MGRRPRETAQSIPNMDCYMAQLRREELRRYFREDVAHDEGEVVEDLTRTAAWLGSVF